MLILSGIEDDGDHTTLIEDMSDQRLEQRSSPTHEGANVSPLRRHQRSINNFLDTMKQHYVSSAAAAGVGTGSHQPPFGVPISTNPSRHQH